ncbi:asparaginase domain-containing protein [Gordonia sp. CPCC 205333]|uniref:asparaginase domain-containing protein n=1 Tax=Gordonia sp. CPCC 205333 TaxID=3140790 RepID=UPI003AF36428
MPATDTAGHIVVITTGGTVAAQHTSTGAIPTLGGADLIARAASGDSAGSLRIIDLMSKDSSAMNVDDQFRIVDAVLAAVANESVRGVVVTHGTDTMEEITFLVDLYLASLGTVSPVVFTGAQFTDDSPEPDGPANLSAALSCAADPSARGRGVLVAMSGTVWPARGLFKVSTSHARAFDVVHQGLGRPSVPLPTPAKTPARIDLLSLYPGVNPGIIAAAAAQGSAGIVLSANGSGNTHPDITAQVSLAVANGIAVVVSTRVPYGEVVPTYGGGGGAVDAVAAGALVSGWLRAPQTRIALMALLSAGATRDEVATFFAASGPVD